MTVRTRFAPSPTGLLHSGNYRTAVFAYLFAKKHGGAFILRIEDTDRERSRREYEDNIIESLAWLDLPYDEVSRQSEHAPRHRAALEQLIEQDDAYISKEESSKEPGKIIEVVRMRNPGSSVTFIDAVRGAITFDTTDLKDFVIAKSLDEPLFHLAVVVDDSDAEVTHVIRGEDHISNTPRQILIQQALGMKTPTYAHLPLILSHDRSKLSKRKGALPLTAYRDQGILPEAMLNYLALVGWNPGDNREYLSRADLIEAFSFDQVQKSSAMFDEVKLASTNQYWMRALTNDEFLERVRFVTGDLELDSTMLRKVIPLLKERAHTFKEARDQLTGELGGLFRTLTLSPEVLTRKEPGERQGLTKEAMEGLLEPIISLPEGVSPEAVKETIMPLADAEEAAGKGGRGAVLWPLRYALSGLERSPDPFTLINLLGPVESASRVRAAIAIL